MAFDQTALGRLRRAHRVTLALGFVLGAAVLLSLGRVPLDFGGELERARELGLVSLALHAGQAPSEPVVRYLMSLALPVLGALLSWSLWARTKPTAALAALLDGDEGVDVGPRRARRWVALLCGVGAALSAVNVSELYGYGGSAAVGPWPFLSEEGIFLAWAQRILGGEVYGRDFACEYGPLSVYALAAWLRLFGETVLASRAFAQVLSGAALAAYALLLCARLRSPAALALVVPAWLLVYNAHGVATLNGSPVRVAVGVAGVYLAHAGAERARPGLRVAAGAALGASLLLSQEVGLCALVAIGVAGALRWLRTRAAPSLAPLGAGLALSLAPPLAYFAAEGALGDVVRNLALYPRLIAQGMVGIPFPPLTWVLSSSQRGIGVLHWAVIGLYAATLAWLAPRLVLRRWSAETEWTAACLVLGVLLFRAALGRADEVHVLYASPPAALLVAELFDRALHRRRTDGLAKALVLAVPAAVLGVGWATAKLRGNVVDGVRDAVEVRRKWTVDDALRAEAAAALPRAGVSLGPLRRPLEELARFLHGATAPGEPVAFLPVDAALYFLLERANPTPFGTVLQASSKGLRERWIDAFERAAPRYVVYASDRWLIDGVPIERAAPEIVAHLRARYRFQRHVGGFAILERHRGGPGPRRP